jgi:hypothetical protein
MAGFRAQDDRTVYGRGTTLTPLRKVLVVAAIACGIAGIRAYVSSNELSFNAASRLEQGATVPHMDHTPRHGGLVLMKGDTHLEVVLDADGSCHAYFTDAVRMELPASHASEVRIGLTNGRDHPQDILLEPDAGGNSWRGELRMVDDPLAIVRITYVARGEAPYWIDVPLSAWQHASLSRRK